MPPKSSQKQKQRQTVIVNIGDKLLVKKRKRKPRKKAGAAVARPPPPPPPSQELNFARVIYPVNNLRPDDNTTAQLNALSAQLKALQAAGAGNLPAQAAAAATVNPIVIPTPVTRQTQAPKPRGRAGFDPLSPIIPPPVQDESPVNPLAAQVDTSIGNPLAAAAELGGGGGGGELPRSTSRKVRSDKDKPRGPSLKTAARAALANDATLQSVKNPPANPLQAAEQPATLVLDPIREKKLKVAKPK